MEDFHCDIFLDTNFLTDPTMTLPGGLNTASFLVYVEKILLPTLWVGAIVVMDNLPVHYAGKVEALIKSVGAKIKEILRSVKGSVKKFVSRKISQWKSSIKLNSKSIQSSFPISDRHGPFLGNIANCQINNLHGGLIIRKGTMIPQNLSQSHIH